MSGTKYRDRETNRVVTLTGDEAAGLAHVKRRGSSEARFVPISGTSEVAHTDRTGRVRVTNMDPDSLAKALSRGNKAFSPVGDSNRDEVHQVAAEGAEEAAWRSLASDQVGETFMGNLLPGSRALNRMQMTEEDAAQDAMLTRMQDEENPLAAGVGTAAQLIGTSLVPIPGLGVASGLYKAGKAKSALSLLGFADEAGQLLTRGLAGAKTPGVAAKLAGRVSAGAITNIPLSIQFQAAQAVDYDRPLTAEAFSRNLGTHILLGAAFDIAIPGAGMALRGLAKGAKAVSPGNLLKKASDFVSARHILSSDKFTLAEKFAVIGGRAKQLRGNTARRMAGREVLEEAVNDASIYGRAAAESTPSKLKINATGSPQAKSLQRMEQGLDDLAAMNPEIASMPEWAVAREGVIAMAGLPKAVNTAAVKAEMAADTLVGYLRAPNLPKRLSVAKGKGIEFRSAANTLRKNLEELGVPTKTADDLEKLLEGATHDKDAVWQAFQYRNRVVADSLKGSAEDVAVANAVKTHLDEALSGLGDDMADALNATDTIFASIQGIRGGTPIMRQIDDHVTGESFGAGPMSAHLRAARGAAEFLDSQKVLKHNNVEFVSPSLEGADTMLDSLAGRFEVAGAMNAVRRSAAKGYEAIPNTPLAGGEATATFGKFEAVGQYLKSTGETIEEGIQRAIGTKAKHGAATSPILYGVFQFRNMETLDQKKESYEALRERVFAMTATDDTLIDNVERMTAGLQDDPELAGTVAGTAVQAAQYLKSHMPQGPQGIIPTRAPSPSPSEITTTLEMAGALDDPVSVLDATLRGSLRQSGLDAVRTVFPHMLADMQVQLAEGLMSDPEVYAKIPYRIRLDINTFLGGGFEPSASPQSLVAFSNRSAQTQAQEKALRGGSASRKPSEPDSASDRLAAF